MLLEMIGAERICVKSIEQRWGEKEFRIGNVLVVSKVLRWIYVGGRVISSADRAVVDLSM